MFNICCNSIRIPFGVTFSFCNNIHIVKHSALKTLLGMFQIITFYFLNIKFKNMKFIMVRLF